MTPRILLLLCAIPLAIPAQSSVNNILQQYINAVGGSAAVHDLKTLAIEAVPHRGPKAKLYWEAPDKVERVRGREREGFDGSTGWLETKKRKTEKLPKAAIEELETDANPIRYVRLTEMYGELRAGARTDIDGDPMDVIIAPNRIAATEFYFDAHTHLLARIEELGVTSAYYKHVTTFSDYKPVGNVKLPFKIERESEEPGAEKGRLRLAHATENVLLEAAIFNRPKVAVVALGGKR